MKPIVKNVIVPIIFSVAMAALESAVVVYLRALYYSEGFTVVFKLIDKQIVFVEILREAATLVMLCSVGYLAGKKKYERFAYFLLSFAIWDIFYYVWLKVFIDWPSSLFEWDILFLIPITWLGPVLSPIICSVTMIIFAWVVLTATYEVRFSRVSLSLLATGCVLILYTYLYDYGNIIIHNNLTSEYANLLQNKKFITLASSYLPQHYNWLVFCLGELLISVAIVKLFVTTRNQSTVNE